MALTLRGRCFFNTCQHYFEVFHNLIFQVEVRVSYTCFCLKFYLKLPAEITSGNEKLIVEVASDSRTGNTAASVDVKQLEQLFEKAEADESGRKTVVLDMREIEAKSSYTLETSITGFSSAGTENEILLNTGFGTIGIPGNMLTGLENVAGDKAAITIGQGDKVLLH